MMPGHRAERDTQTPDDERPLVLIVDDNPVVRMLLEGICSEYGWNTAGVANSADAILTAGLQHVDLMVVDYNLKEGNALRLLAKLRAIRPSTPLVVVTRQSPEDVEAVATAAGAHGVIGKPRSVEEIAKLLEDYIPDRTRSSDLHCGVGITQSPDSTHTIRPFNRSSSDGGMLRRSASAVFRLMLDR
jgi:CheY-like chemotaxis protein